MESVQYVVHEYKEKFEYAYENVQWKSLGETALHSELMYLSVFFLLSKMLMRKLPEDIRKAYLNPFLKFYNGGMSLFSLVSFVAMAKSISEIDLYSDDCDAAFNHPLFAMTAKAFLYSKFVEYIDSWSLILAGKRVSFLQSFHHLGAPWDMWVFLIAKNEGIWIFVLLNGFVHTIMYAYYLATLCKIRTPLKPLITVLQVAQFNIGFYFIWWYKDIPCYAESPERILGWVFNYFYVGVVLVLFLNFSLWTYIFPKTAKKVKSA